MAGRMSDEEWRAIPGVAKMDDAEFRAWLAAPLTLEEWQETVDAEMRRQAEDRRARAARRSVARRRKTLAEIAVEREDWSQLHRAREQERRVEAASRLRLRSYALG